VQTLLRLAVSTAHRLADKVFEAEDYLADRPALARRIGNVGASLLVEVSTACDGVQVQDYRARMEAAAALREARVLVGKVRHAVSLDCSLIRPELREAIMSDCDELLALLLASTAEAMRAGTPVR